MHDQYTYVQERQMNNFLEVNENPRIPKILALT